MGRPEEQKPKPPAYMVSFGDMMTLILTFFILLVSMSREQAAGLTARGVGSFVMALKSHGLSGILSEEEKAAIFEEVRVRFNLPPEWEPERREEHTEAAQLELIRSQALDALEPHDELTQPSVALFEQDSAVLSERSHAYLDRLASTLRPARPQLLILEGHANDAGPAHGDDDRWLAFARAAAVRAYLLDVHGFDPDRVEARAWVRELPTDSSGTRGVDARLVTPSRHRLDD